MNNRGFTMIELMGTLVIIAVLTVAGIAAIASSINKSRVSATMTDLSGFCLPIEQFLMENPQLAKSDDDGFIASELNKYLEGEMQFINIPQIGDSADDLLDYSTVQTSGWQVKHLDPWDQPYRIYIDTSQHDGTNGSSPAKDTEIRIYVISNGKNSTTGAVRMGNRYLDGIDDLFLCVEYVNGHISSGYYGFDSGISDFVNDTSTGTELAQTIPYLENGSVNAGSIMDLDHVSLTTSVSCTLLPESTWEQADSSWDANKPR